MRAPAVFCSYGLLLQAYFAVQALRLAAVALLEPPSITREIIEAPGKAGWIVLWMMMVCACFLLLDILLNHELKLWRYFRWLSRYGWVWGLGLCFGWAAQAFVASHFLYAPGFVTAYLADSIFLGVAMLIDASRRRASYVSDCV